MKPRSRRLPWGALADCGSGSVPEGRGNRAWVQTRGWNCPSSSCLRRSWGWLQALATKLTQKYHTQERLSGNVTRWTQAVNFPQNHFTCTRLEYLLLKTGLSVRWSYGQTEPSHWPQRGRAEAGSQGSGHSSARPRVTVRAEPLPALPASHMGTDSTPNPAPC